MINKRVTGVLLVLVSALVFSSAGLFVRAVQADAWTIIFWRGLFAAIFTSVYILQRRGWAREVSAMGRSGVAAAAVGALGTAAFIPAFKLTTIANVSLIYAVAPFVAALVMWVWIREKPNRLVLVASLLAFSGVLVIVFESLGSVTLQGDLLALLMTVCMSVYVCIYRKFPDTPAAGPALLMSLMLLPAALFLGVPFAATLSEIMIIACFGAVFSIASVTLAEGARRLPAAETALLSAMETPLAPIWAWVLLSEFPTAAVLVGGAIILVSVFGSLCLQAYYDKDFARRARGVANQAEPATEVV